MEIQPDDIAFVQLDNQLVCYDCITEKEMPEIKANEITTRDECDSIASMLFCDRCKSQL